jgi:FkbM family methyltransferase
MPIFRYNDIQITYPPIHYPFLIEVYVLDIYRSNLLNKGDVVLDLGAGVGDFSVLASKKVGPAGKVIAVEPDPETYDLLEVNITNNNCMNVISLNTGVASSSGIRSITFRGRNYSFQVNTLRHLLQIQGIQDKINFIKMDIEGFETEVIENSLDIIKNVAAISVELHGTKHAVDKLLCANGFSFVPISKSHIRAQVIKNLVLHPKLLYRSYKSMKLQNPRVLSSVIQGLNYDRNKAYLSGTYIKL